MGIYLIIGALISSAIQTFVPKNALMNLGANTALSLPVMMAAAFIMSVCSTSDAFIARTFINAMPLVPVMGFMVLGPMLDLKNLLLLSGKFTRPFTVRLVAMIVLISFVVLLAASGILHVW